MALATKCPQCGAMFRVVADQLKLRGGLVRCGQCRTVFDAIGSLAYVEDTTLTALPGNTAPMPPASSKTEKTETPVSPSRSHAAAGTQALRPSDRERERVDRKRKALGPATTLRIAPGAAPVATVSMALPPALPAGSTKAADLEELAASEAGVPTLL